MPDVEDNFEVFPEEFMSGLLEASDGFDKVLLGLLRSGGRQSRALVEMLEIFSVRALFTRIKVYKSLPSEFSSV